MDDKELAGFLRRKIQVALNDDGDDVSARRERNMKFYRGDLYGNERAGHSKVVTREVMEAVEWAMPSIMRTILQANALTFEPVGPEDEEAADQETDVVRYYLWEKNNGFVALHNWCKDALLYPTGYAKIWIERDETTSTNQLHGLSQYQLADVVNTEGVQVLGQQQTVGLDGSPLFNIEIKLTEQKNCLRFEAVPPEEVLVDADHRFTDLDCAPFVAHKSERTLSELIEQGYDRDRLEEVGTDESAWGTEETERQMFNETGDDDDDGVFTVYECYCLVDTDDDGVAERRRVVLIGDQIFENEEIDYVPLVAMSAILMPHQHTGMSLADMVADLQEVGSALTRQLLTNIYRQNVSRKYVGTRALVDGGLTIDALLNQESELVPVEDPSAIVPEMVAPIAQSLLPVMQHMDMVKQVRTGINPQMALDPKILRDTTQGAFQTALDNSTQRLEMIVRVMAETGIKQAFCKAHRLIREHLGNSVSLRLRNRWVDVSPMQWKERTDVQVKVGVGHAKREQKAESLMKILSLQTQGMQMGMPFIGPQQLFNSLSELVQTEGFRDAEQFFMNPQKMPPPQPPPPDPMQELAKAQAQSLMVEAQAKQAKVQSDMQEMQLRGQIEMAKLQLERAKGEMAAFRQQQELQASREASVLDFQIKSAELEHKGAERKLKEAQTVKTLEEARALDIENDATESGVLDVLEGGSGQITRRAP